MDSKFKEGDVVTLKCGSPKMVISNITYQPPVPRPINAPDNIVYDGYHNYALMFFNTVAGRMEYLNCSNSAIFVESKD